MTPTRDRGTRRLLRLCTLFLDHYGDGPVSLLRAPARISVLGEHIDYVSYLPTASLTFGSREHDVLMLYRNSGGPQVRGASTSPDYEPSSFDVLEDQVPAFSENVAADWLSFLFQAPHTRTTLAKLFARGSKLRARQVR